MSVWYRITGFRGSGPPCEEESDESPGFGAEPTEPDRPSDNASPEPPEPDQPSDNANPEPAEQDEPYHASPEPTEQDEPHDDSLEPTEQDEPHDDSLEPNEPTGSTQNRRGAPRQHGGRRGPHNRPRESPGDGPRPFVPKSELICRKPIGSWQWEIVLSVPQERKVERVLQGDKELSAKNREYNPLSFSGSIVIEYDDGDGDEIQLFDNAPLVFKLPNQWEGDGRRVRDVTRGHFIVIAPCKWTRKGRVRVSPERCVDEDFTAHFFYKGQDDEPNDFGGFEEHTLSLARTGFELKGRCIYDDSEEGDLFVGAAPVLKPADGVVWARVGEEAHSGWQGQNFRPAEKSLRDVLGRRQGRFYVRVYDESVELVDSGEFRYCADLQEIQVNGESYSRDMILAPSPDGHSQTTLQFVDTRGSAIPAHLKEDSTHILVRPDGVMDVAPHPDGDETTWSLKPCGGTEVVIRLPRIWWRIIRPDVMPDGWRDNAASMSRDEFREQSYAEAEVEIRVPSSVKNVHAGFGSGNDLDQSFRAERTESGLHQVSLPLKAFVYYEEIDEPSTEDVSVNIRCGHVEIALIHIIPDPPAPVTELPPQEAGPPQLEPEPSQQEARRNPERHAYVRRPDGNLRYGKGFSHHELQAVGMTTADAARLSIPTDRRRRTAHRANIEALDEVKSDA